MAKRKRLTPPDPAFLEPSAPETKSMFSAPARPAPIADVAREASASAALSEMADTLARAREEGRMVVTLPLDRVVLDHLVRDRVVVEEEAMQSLMASLRDRGQQTPVEVVALADGRYGLISGWRRCKALRLLAEERGDPEPEVLALLRRPEEASDAYLAMVEENEIRVDLSYFERARIVVRAVDEGVFAAERYALQELFRAASRAKRSKIGSFLPVVRALDGVLLYPQALSERMGLTLAQMLAEDAGFAARLRAALKAADRPDAAAEQAVLTQEIAAQKQSLKAVSETESTAKPAPFRDETVGAFTLRRHREGGVTILGAPLTPALEAGLKKLLLGASPPAARQRKS